MRPPPIIFLVFRVLALILLLAVPARAEVAGSADPRFAAARAAWLADDEATALPEFAALASEGNRAAQILLALIDVTPETQGPWLAAQPHEARNALLRAPGGLSGLSWMRAAAADTPLAETWVTLGDAAADSEIASARAFAALGEPLAARAALLNRAARQRRGFADLADDPDYPPALRYLVWREWALDPDGLARLADELNAARPGDPQVGRFDARADRPEARDAWLAADPLAAPLRDTCAAICPGGTVSCTRAAFDLVGGYHGLITFGSPSETLIPYGLWSASPRGRLALLRVSAARNPTEGWRLRARIATADACLGAALAAETARFGL